jgi:thiamine biosynthesis protein ThiS
MTAMEMNVRLKVNGQERQYPERIRLEELLDRLGLERQGLVVELNREILPRERFAEIELKENDALELIQFVGGG